MQGIGSANRGLRDLDAGMVGSVRAAGVLGWEEGDTLDRGSGMASNKTAMTPPMQCQLRESLRDCQCPDGSSQQAPTQKRGRD